jgi:hypothetical protein
MLRFYYADCLFSIYIFLLYGTFYIYALPRLLLLVRHSLIAVHPFTIKDPKVEYLSFSLDLNVL